jgi:ubiquinone/menaquinone biosynthesis C-methylase UbiE
MNKNNYFLSTGSVDEVRLGIINKIYNPVSYAFLTESGIKPGMNVLEIGCGYGHTAIWLAKQVLPTGKVYAIDYSEDSLVIARENAKKLRVNNIEFINLDLANIKDLNQKFDFSYGRWVLEFCKPAQDTFKNIHSLLNVDGIFTYEALNFAQSDHFSYPENSAVKKWNEFVVANAIKNNSELTLAHEIYHLIDDIGYKNIFARRHQPILRTPEEKSLYRLALLSAKNSWLKNNVTPENEINELIEKFEELEKDASIMGFYNNTLIRGIR